MRSPFLAPNKHTMKKHLYSLFALFLVAQSVWAEIQPSVTLTDYYATADGKSGEALRTALSDKIRPHTTVTYDQLKYLFKWTDTYNNAGSVIDDIYSFCDPAYTESWCSGTCGYNREHSVPKSWFGEATPLYSDAFHLYPTNCYVNSYRGNEPYGECANGTKCTTNGVQAKGRKGASTFPGYTISGVVYELEDEFKGDLARTYFYMVTCYMTSDFTQAAGGRVMFTYQNNKAQLTPYSVDLLLKWHRQDPVSERELARNEVIYGNTTLNKCEYKQGNRNPFIDYPELAEYIWGNKAGQSVNVAALISGYSNDTVPPTPPTPHDKYGVTWSANGEELFVDSLPAGAPIVMLPPMPESCSTESDTFMGWTTTPIDSTTDEAPAVLYTQPADFPPVTADVTYYAVFAKMESEGAAVPATYVYDAEHQEGWTNTAENKGSYWLIKQGTSIVSPEIDLMYLESIVVKMRTYGGSSNNELIVSEADGELTKMIATGSTLTDCTWINNLYIAGTSTLTFTTNYTGNAGVGVQSITINAAGSKTIYSRYITSCQEPTELIELVPEPTLAHKLLIGGQIYIVRDGKVYSITGARVR